MRRLILLGIALLEILSLPLMAEHAPQSGEFKAGIARVKITPPLPMWLSGFAARTNSVTEVLQDLWAKALALEDNRGNRVVIVTTDLIGLPRQISDVVAARVRKEFKLDRSQLVLNSSHTHGGPAIWPNLRVMFDFSAADSQRASDYAALLTASLTDVVGASLRDLSPARVFSGHGSVAFAMNRRESTTNGFQIGVNRTGPVDHDVPVLKVMAPTGQLRAVLFGYACHNTTLGADIYKVNGDYAGFAQAEVEKQFPGAMAMFLMLCGGDQNPYPRHTLDLAKQHGGTLAVEVARVVSGNGRPVHPSIRTAYRQTRLDFAPHDRRQFEQEAKHENRFHQRRAALMLEACQQGKPVRSTPYPVQAVRLGGDLTLLALGGEVVVDYSLRAKREFPRENLIVAGYCNDVMSYIPSKRVLREGGYEPVESMIYYGQPGPYCEDVEERVFQAVHRVMKRAGVR